MRSDVEAVRDMTEALIASQAAKVEDKIEDLVDKELADMDQAIEEAASRIAAILEKSRAAETGIKLEVSEKILDTCTALMQVRTHPAVHPKLCGNPRIRIPISVFARNSRSRSW